MVEMAKMDPIAINTKAPIKEMSLVRLIINAIKAETIIKIPIVFFIVL